MLNTPIADQLDIDELDVNEFIDHLFSVIEEQSEEINHQIGLIAVMRDAIGQIVVCLNSNTQNKTVDPSQQQMVKSIDKTFATLPKDVRRFITKATEFHFSAKKLNLGYPTHIPAWRDDHPLRDLEKMNFFNVVNRYY